MPNPAQKAKKSSYPRKKPRSGSPTTQNAGLRLGGGSNSVKGFTHSGRTFRPFAKKKSAGS